MGTNLLVDITTSTADDSSGTWTEIDEMGASATVAGTGSVVLLIASMSPNGTSTNECASLRLSVDGSPVGPILDAYADNVDEASGITLAFAVTGLSAASHDFSCEWITRTATPLQTDTGRVRTLQVIEFESDAEILVDIGVTSSSGSAPGSFANIADMSASPSVTTGSLLLFIGGCNHADSADGSSDLQFAIDGTRDGPISSIWVDAANQTVGATIMWMEEGTTGSPTLSLQWQNRQGSRTLRTVNRTFQVIEFTGSDWNLGTDLELTSSDTSGAWATLNGMTDTFTPGDSANIMLMMAVMIQTSGTDRRQEFRFSVGGTREGAHMMHFTDETNGVPGACIARAKSGLSSSTAFAVQWQTISSSNNTIDTSRPRTFQIVEFDNTVGPSTAVKDTIMRGGVIPFAR